MDYSNYLTANAEPEATSMFETFRAYGYNVETAIADIIDNSISAGAKNIYIDFEWKGKETWLAIKDDGIGMSNEELINAMRPGSKNPKVERNSADLGRYGLGLKTASFSQCRKLSIISKKNASNPVYWTWDLDFINQTGKWEIINFVPAEFKDALDNTESGTIVIWKDLDRLASNLNESSQTDLNKFLEIMEIVKRHLAMVFHRFIETKRIRLFFQKREVEPWDPFLFDQTSTQKLPEEPISGRKLTMRGFVLPHKSKIDENTYKLAEGPKGWNEQQGFYIYRNERLLMAGDWLGMFRKEEHYKLARIMIDLPNTLDNEWQIDIKKSTARPPLILRDQLKAYANKVRSQAVEVYRHKGKVLQRKFANNTEFHTVWLEKVRHGKRFYEINREHPLLKEVFNSLEGSKTEINHLLRMIEETVPVPLISIKESEQPEMQGQPFENDNLEPIKKTISLIYDKWIREGKTPEQAKNLILNIEPFNLFPHLVEILN